MKEPKYILTKTLKEAYADYPREDWNEYFFERNGGKKMEIIHSLEDELWRDPHSGQQTHIKARASDSYIPYVVNIKAIKKFIYTNINIEISTSYFRM